MKLAGIIEALLIASEEPIATPELARLVRARVAEAEDETQATNESLADNEEKESLAEELSKLASTSQAQVIAAIEELNQAYEKHQRAFRIMERAKGWKIYTRPEYADFVRLLFPGKKPQRLSAPAMETLAIIAYRQPVTKASMEAVRGVSCDGMLQKLLDRELISIGGRAELPGRPLLYQTTDLFFEHFGINSIDDLPNAAELRTVKLPEPKTESEEDTKETSQAELDMASSNETLQTIASKLAEPTKSESPAPQNSPSE